MAVYNFVVQLKDETSAPAKSAADSIKALNEKMRAGQSAMLGLTEKMHATAAAFRAIKDPTKEQTTAFRAQMAAMGEQKAAWGDHTRRLNESKKAWTDHAASVQQATDDAKARAMKYQHAVQTVAGGITTAVGVITGAFGSLAHGDVSGAIGKVTAGISGAVSMLDLALPGLGTGLSLLTSIFGGLIGAIAGAVQSLMTFALHASEGRARAVTMYNALEQGHATGEATVAMLGKLGDSIGWTGSQLQPFAKQLIAMGHRDLPDLKRELLATASAQAIMGEGGGEAYVALARKITHAGDATGKIKMSTKQLDKLLEGVGISAKDMAEKLGVPLTQLDAKLKSGTQDAAAFGDTLRDTLIKQGKAPLEQFRNSLEGVGSRFTNMITRIFAKVDVKPFLDALNEIVDAFGLDTKSGEGMVEALNGAFRMAGDAAKWLVLAIVRVSTWILGAINTVWDWADSFSETGSTGSAALDEIIGEAKALGETIKSLIGFAKDLASVWDKVGGVLRVGTAIGTLGASEAARATIGALNSGGGSEGAEGGKAVGGMMVSGLIEKLNADIAKVTAAGEMIGKAAVEGAKKGTDSHSPSRAMFRIGGYVSEGFALGVRGGAPAANDAVSDMSRYAMGGASEGAGDARSGRAAGGVTHNTFHIQIDGAGKSAEGITEEMLATTFERMQLAAGL